MALGKPKALALKCVKVPMCPLTGVYVRNVPAPDLPFQHSTPVFNSSQAGCAPAFRRSLLPRRACLETWRVSAEMSSSPPTCLADEFVK